MRAKGNKKTKVNIVTLGCSKNLVDSEVLLTQLRGNNIDAVHESKKDDANVVVINTCGFIDNAKQESIDTILRYVDAKEEGLVEKAVVFGAPTGSSATVMSPSVVVNVTCGAGGAGAAGAAGVTGAVGGAGAVVWATAAPVSAKPRTADSTARRSMGISSGAAVASPSQRAT